MSKNIEDMRVGICAYAGTYGAYMHWVLYSLTQSAEPVSPLLGSTAHNFNYSTNPRFVCTTGKRNFNRAWQHDEIPYSVFIFYPGESPHLHEHVKNMPYFQRKVDYIVGSYPGANARLLTIHNDLHKDANGTLWNHPLAFYTNKDLFNVYKGWGVKIGTKPDDIEPWILREFYSITLFDHWDQRISWNLAEQYKHPNCKFFNTYDLMTNFVETCYTLIEFLDLEIVRQPETLTELHQQFLSKQEFLGQDQLADRIINLEEGLSWAPKDITIITEAYIQKQLRDKGIGLQCDGLNQFPTSTKELSEIFE